MPKIMIVEGSLNPRSTTAVFCRLAEAQMVKHGAEVDFLDLRSEPLPLYTPGQARQSKEYTQVVARVEQADGFILGTPDYHGGPSGALKNFLDFFWREFTGKLFGYICASHEKGLSPMDQLRVHVRQCYGWSLPYGVSGMESDVSPDGEITNERLDARLAMLARDMVVYTKLLSDQRSADIAGSDPGFAAILRPKS